MSFWASRTALSSSTRPRSPTSTGVRLCHGFALSTPYRSPLPGFVGRPGNLARSPLCVSGPHVGCDPWAPFLLLQGGGPGRRQRRVLHQAQVQQLWRGRACCEGGAGEVQCYERAAQTGGRRHRFRGRNCIHNHMVPIWVHSRVLIPSRRTLPTRPGELPGRHEALRHGAQRFQPCTGRRQQACQRHECPQRAGCLAPPHGRVFGEPARRPRRRAMERQPADLGATCPGFFVSE